VNLTLSRNGATQTVNFPTLQPDRTSRVYVQVVDSNGTLLPQQVVYLSVQVDVFMQPRIVAIQGVDISPTPNTIAITNSNGLIQVNIALWRGPSNNCGNVRLYANLTNIYYSGKYIQTFFPA
ncbi:hypothetical protein, partial [Brucella sp. B13-0095]|uniref:hypothetical protein n=1 Tax=Brucella sp. B13-0095 TaxID=1867845 RepID=UPI001AECAC45